MSEPIVTQVIGDSVLVRKVQDPQFRKLYPIMWKSMIEGYAKGLKASEVILLGLQRSDPIRLADWIEFVRDVEGPGQWAETQRQKLKEIDIAPGWFEYQILSLKVCSERNLWYRFYAGFYFIAFVLFGGAAAEVFQGFGVAHFLVMDESYSLAFVGLFLGLSVLGISKGLILVLLHVLASGSLPETRVAFRGIMLDLSVDTSPIEAHRDFVVKIFFFATSAVSYLAAAYLWSLGSLPGLNSASLFVLAVLLTFLSLNPKRRGETSKIFGIVYPSWKARRSLSYLENRSLFGLFQRGRWVEDESHLLLFAFLCLGWSLSFLVFLGSLLVANIGDLSLAVRTVEGTLWGSLVLIGVILGGIILIVVYELWRVLIRNFLFLFQRQIQNFLRNRSVRTEKTFDPEKIRAFMAKSPLFQGFPSQVIDGFLKHGYIQVVRSGQPVIVQGNVGTELYMILEGEAVVRRQDPIGVIQDLAVLSKGAIFGEISLLRNVVRTASVVSLSPMRIFVLPKNDFEELFRGLNVQTLEQRIALSGVLGDSSVFKDLPRETLQIILGYGEFREFKKGEIVIEQGDRDKDFYIVLRGRVEVVRAGDIRLSEFGPAGFFGEVSLFENRPRSATVRALEDAVLLKLSSDGFWRMVDQSPNLAANIQELSWLRRQTPENLAADAI